MTYTIKRITTSTTKRDGTALIDKKGRPFLKVGLQVAEHGEQWVNGLFFGTQVPWKEGEKVDLVISKETYNGKEQLKFEIPRKENPNAKANEEILNKLTKIELMVIKIGQHLMPPKNKIDGTDVDYPAGDPEEVKF